MLLQTVQSATAQAHPLSGTIAEWVWLLPVLPLAGFVINGLLSLSGAHFGPSDPNTPGHYPDAEGTVSDEHHPATRHRWASRDSLHPELFQLDAGG